ncbi:hypothetical protein M378DRAFT_171018 [Amanita muscaria Koide BX008]|uniref:Uncharacterized protein n=1 Tax=Amanita muscaria (strain Koide BX008) TaxID=946122 RepID=A0A0C2WA71_AMAMK|nr:hypothetical protein M378DRAFT_171018 [Amanita muscaria Koide BX008]
MSVEYLKTAPRIWSLLDALLSVRTRRRSSLLLEPNRMTAGENLGGHWTDTESSKKENRRNTLSQIVRVIHASCWCLHSLQKKTVILSMLMHGANQKANKFASIFGIFLHSCRTPQRVVNALQRMGLCVTQTNLGNLAVSQSPMTTLTSTSKSPYLLLKNLGTVSDILPRA